MAVAVGDGFTLALTEDGNLWATGSNDHGQLGIGNLQLQDAPVLINKITAFAGEEVTMVSADAKNAACVTADGDVYTWGSNSDGQLGRGFCIFNVTTPGRLDKSLFGNSPAVMVACGADFTIILTAQGHVWTCGQNYRGQLGLNHNSDVSVPTQIDPVNFGHAPIGMIAAGSDHSMALSCDGAVFTWGWNNHTQLGLGDGSTESTSHRDPLRKAKIWIPSRVPVTAFGGAAAVFISAGSIFSMVVTADGVLWACGAGNEFRLGLGHTKLYLGFQRVGGHELFGEGGVRMIACGYAHSLIVAKNGTMWSCGYGGRACLGTGKNNNERPTRVDMSELSHSSVVVVAAGLHSVAVTAHGRVSIWGMLEGSGPDRSAVHNVDRLTPPFCAETHWTPCELSALSFSGERVGRWHDMREEHMLAFAMGRHADLAAVGGRTAYSDIFPEELLRGLFDSMRFQARAGASPALYALMGVHPCYE